MSRHASVHRAPAFAAAALAAFLVVAATPARASDAPPANGTTEAPTVLRADGLEPLVPELSAHPYRLAPGPRRFLHRLSFSPAYGRLGAERLFAFRFAYNPNAWLGWEGSIGHNPGQSTHAVVHGVNAVLRYPLPGRFQPFATAGYGMVMVFPGQSVNADPVTKNALAYGGGLEIYIRSDLALRADVQHATVFGRERNRFGVVAFDYLQHTIGIAFYRSVRP